MHILFFGDIVGKIARQAIKKILPDMKKEFAPDIVIANVENLAHGKGITQPTINEMVEAGVDVFTTGNHISAKESYKELLENSSYRIIRPANYPPEVPGKGYTIIDTGSAKIIVINLMGRIFFKETLDDPFRSFDTMYEKYVAPIIGPKYIIIDWHAEASSEKMALGWHVDGRVSAVLGTHTHTPTADTRILPRGTAYVSDVGMVGARDSILGVTVDGPLVMMKTQLKQKFDIPETGTVQINSVYLELDTHTHKALSIQRVDREVEII